MQFVANKLFLFLNIKISRPIYLFNYKMITYKSLQILTYLTIEYLICKQSKKD